MARKNTNEEVVQDIDEGGYIQDKAAGGSSTVGAAIAAGVSTITVALATGFAAGDSIRIGSGNKLEENIIDSSYTTGTSLPLRMPTAYAHALGEAVVEREKIVIGEITDQGVKVGTTVNENRIKTATTKGIYVSLLTDVDHTFNAATINHSLDNVALAFGMPESAVTGAGTTASPHRLVVTTTNVRSRQNISLYMLGSLYDGRTLEIQGWNVDLGASGEWVYNTGPGTPVPYGGSCRAVARLLYT